MIYIYSPIDSQKHKEIIMAFNMKNRHLLSLVHHTEREIKYLLDLSRDLKRAKYTGTEQQKLKGKNIQLPD